MTVEQPPPRTPRHPLLGLTPPARRELARTLIRGMDTRRSRERTASLSAGARGAAVSTGLGLALGAGWLALGGTLGPFALAYAAVIAGQAAAARRLLGRQFSAAEAPAWVRGARAVALAPADALDAVRATVAPARVDPTRLVLAAGVLVAVRHPLSSTLLRRLMGRACPQAEVDGAIALLIDMHLIARPPQAPGVLVLTRAGSEILRELGVEAPVARPRRDPAIPAHLQSVFQELEARAGTRRPIEPQGPHLPFHAEPDAPARPLSQPAAPLPPPLVRPDESSRIIAFRPAEAPVVAPPAIEASAPEPVAPPFIDPVPLPEPIPFRPRKPTPSVELPHPTVYPGEAEADEEAEEDLVGRIDVPTGPKPRLRLRFVATAAAVALLGLLVYVVPFPTLRTAPSPVVRLSADGLPNSRGTALQFDGKGFLLSSFGGDLFLSIPERLDYKRPLSFQGFDMAADCGLIDRDIQNALMAPLGRFLWVSLGKEGRERCLVDLETRTVTHDLPRKQKAYGLRAVVGWAGPQTLLMATQVPPLRVARWMAIDVVSHVARPVAVPDHVRVIPLAADTGPGLLAGFDPKGDGVWSLTTYWLGEGPAYQKVRSIEITLPTDLAEALPHVASLSPDKRFLLLGLARDHSSTGALATVSLEDGTVTPLAVSPAPLIDAPIFFGPGVRDGNYRFYFNGEGPDGVSPWAGEMAVKLKR